MLINFGKQDSWSIEFVLILGVLEAVATSRPPTQVKLSNQSESFGEQPCE